MDQAIQVSNGTHQIIVQVSDPNTIWLVIATVVLAIATWFVVWITHRGNKESNQFTRESNDLLKLDITNKIRPDLQVVNFSPEPLREGDTTARFFPNIINYGTTSAHSIRIYFKTYLSINNLTDFVKDEDEIKSAIFMPYDGSLLPTQPLRFIMPIEYPLNGQPIRVMVWIEHKFLENNVNEVIFSIRLQNERYLDHVYYSNSDIIRAREQWRKFKAGETGALM
ncbi:MAG: hypothetical protein KGH85_07800 [Thaumarchaeota archaeon]|nr:hypothetical protein [Nitrososphaerota archaeon]